MTVFICSIILILTLIVLPFCLTVNAGVDILGNSGYIKLRLFFIPLFSGKIHLEALDLKHSNLILEFKRKREEIHLNADKNDKQSIRNFIKKVPILSAIRVRNVTFDAAIGKSDDAFFTTLTAGSLRTVFYALAAVLKSREDVTVRERILAVYTEDKLQANVFGIISLSIANIIYSLWTAFKNLLKTPRRIRRRRACRLKREITK